MLLFSSNQAAGLVLIPYPPFGLVTVSFFGLASYLLLIGIYSSAISVAEDSNLRRSIRSFAMKESRLLDSIGTAQMEEEIQKKVITFTRRNQDRMAEETGIQSSLTDEDMKEYLEQVIREVKKDRQAEK
jgi:polyhydroxyalkanoate synthesis regulator protein